MSLSVKLLLKLCINCLPGDKWPLCRSIIVSVKEVFSCSSKFLVPVTLVHSDALGLDISSFKSVDFAVSVAVLDWDTSFSSSDSVDVVLRVVEFGWVTSFRGFAVDMVVRVVVLGWDTSISGSDLVDVVICVGRPSDLFGDEVEEVDAFFETLA